MRNRRCGGEHGRHLRGEPIEQVLRLEEPARVRSGPEHDDRDLLTAGLLHDAGKGTIATWHRVTYVLAPAGLLARVARPGDGAGWRETFYRCLHHETLGAERAREAGSNARVVALIRGESAQDPLAAALHAGWYIPCPVRALAALALRLFARPGALLFVKAIAYSAAG